MSANSSRIQPARRGSAQSLLAVLLLVPLLALGMLAARFASAETLLQAWHEDFSRAAAEAERLQRPLLIHFHAQWCVPCKRMEQEILSRPALLQHLGTTVVGVKVDADQSPELVKQFGIDSVPTDVFVDPDGKVIAVYEGYQDGRKYLGHLAQVDSAFNKKWLARRPAAPESPQRPDSPPRRLVSDRQEITSRTIDAPATGSPKEDLGAEQADDRPPAVVEGDPPVLGLSGYSPVALYQWRRWEKGKAEFSWTHKGIEYRMASAEELAEFRESPAKFAPRLLGCDPVILWETDRAIPGETKYGAYFDGELYLFLNPETRQRFRQNPMRYTRTRHVLLPTDLWRSTR